MNNEEKSGHDVSRDNDEEGRDRRDGQKNGVDFLSLWDSDPIEAEKKEWQSRQKLVTFGAREHLSDPEELADNTIAIAYNNFVENSLIYAKIDSYLFGIARNLVHKWNWNTEQLDEQRHDKSLPEADDYNAMPQHHKRCLKSCLEKLEKRWRAAFILYYDDGEEDIDQEQNWEVLATKSGMNHNKLPDRKKGNGARKHNRKILAALLQITPRQLNRKMTTIRAQTKDCIEKCVERQSAE